MRRRDRIRRLAALAALVCLGGLGTRAVTPVPPSSLPTNRPADRATVFSTTHRYAVSGCPAAQALPIATWAEDVESRLGRFLGIGFVSPEPLPVQIRLVEDPAAPRGRVLRMQRFDAGMLDQRLEMVNPRLADQEDLLEGLCSLLLSRAMVARLPDLTRTNQPPRVPDWLAVGAAQNLYPEARARNHATTIAVWRKGGGHALGDVLTWEYMPAGRWDDKAEAGLFLEYLLPPSLASKRMTAILACIEAGDAVTADFLARHILFCGSAAQAEKLRDLWLAQQQDVQTGFGGISQERVAELVRMLVIRPADYGIAESAKIPLIADLRDLVPRRSEAWVRDLAARMSMKMKSLALGQAQEFQRVVAAYVSFLDALAGAKRGLLGGGASTGALRKLLDQAETELVNFQAAQKQRDSFLKEAARRDTAPPSDAIGSYLDMLEKRDTPPVRE